MRPHVRDALTWLHTWGGLLLGTLLFAIFWTGTLSVFDREIDRWMMPETRVSAPPSLISADAAWEQTRRRAVGSPLWVLHFPTEREPTVRIQFAEVGSAARAIEIEGSRKGIPLPRENLSIFHFDPNTGQSLPDPGTKGASDFFFPFHWHLLAGEESIGQWIVGFAALAMMVLIVSGVVIHRELFSQFFTLRTRKRSGRMILDTHNAAAVLALPFHVIITFSGLAIFYFFYFPLPLEMTHKGGQRQLFEESRAGFSRPSANTPGEMASLDQMVSHAQELWGGGTPAQVTITFPGDANAYVRVTRSVADKVRNDPRPVYFDARSGEVLKFSGIHPVATAQRYIAGLHFIGFHHWLVRWLYFILGLAGCLMIATGALFWLQKRRKIHGETRTTLVVDVLAVGSTTGIILASEAYLIANRVLPTDLAARADWEIRVFFLAWIATFMHAGVRRRASWRDQWWIIAWGAVLAVLLNALTTGDDIVHTTLTGNWAVAGTDAMLLLTAVLAAATARYLRRPRTIPSGTRVALEANG